MGVGLKMTRWVTRKQKKQAKAKFAKKFFTTDKRSTSDDYLCSTNDERMDPHITQTATHDQITRAEAGKYVIIFHVSDRAGNKETKTLKRTVIVRDTLPPVITLTLKKWGLMEEAQTSVNGWVIGAIASAVAGVALLGLSTKQTATSVPV